MPLTIVTVIKSVRHAMAQARCRVFAHAGVMETKLAAQLAWGANVCHVPAVAEAERLSLLRPRCTLKKKASIIRNPIPLKILISSCSIPLPMRNVQYDCQCALQYITTQFCVL